MAIRHVGDYGGVIPEFDTSWLRHRADSVPDRLAIRTAEAELTYSELEAEARAVATRLVDEGVQPGTGKVLGRGRGPTFPIGVHALLKIGAVVVPEAPHVSASGPTAFAPGVACRLYTSGTTGEPRPVDLTLGNFWYSAVGTSLMLGIGPQDRWLCCLPVHHVAGFSILTRAAICGIGAVLHEGFDVDRVAESFAEDDVTLVSLVATQLVRLLEADVDLTRPRAIVLGGGPVPVDVIEEATGRGATVIQVYGMTETTSQVTVLETADAERKVGSAGRAVLGAGVRIQDGEIQVTGPVVAPGSAGDGEWLRTGDLGSIDSEGYLWVDGRKDDLIVTGGENVMPERVEEVLRAHPDVADAAVVGRPHPEWQQAVTAIVVLRPGAPEDAEALRAHSAQDLAGYEVPKSFIFVPDLPRTASGKLMRSVLR
jgi:o-succinylbenzoate---CoA ligase